MAAESEKDWRSASGRFVRGSVWIVSRHFRKGHRHAGALSDGACIFAPDVLGCKFDIEHGGLDLRMSHEVLEGRQGDARPHHVRTEGMSKSVRIGGRNGAAQSMMTE